MEWLRSAAYPGEDSKLFFPVGTTGPALRDITDAKAVRARRPVITRCPSFTLSSGQTAGVRGGTGEEERIAPLRTAKDDSTRRSTV